MRFWLQNKHLLIAMLQPIKRSQVMKEQMQKHGTVVGDPKPARGPKMRKCCNKACRKPYHSFQSFVCWCSPECGSVIALEKLAKQKAKAQRAERAETKAKLAKFKTRNEYIAEAQVAFNAFIRARDADKPCICCGRTSEKEYLTGSNWDCGHYRSTGSAPHMRFMEDNAHRQLTFCNRNRAGNAVEYRLGLIARIGLERVEALESDNTVRKWSIDDLKAIKAEYRAKLAQLKKEK